MRHQRHIRFEKHASEVIADAQAVCFDSAWDRRTFRLLARSLFALSLCLVMCSLCVGEPPPIPPLTNGDGNIDNNGMKHANVALADGALSIHIGTPPVSPVTAVSGFGVDYTPDKFDVLEDTYFNAQHGWLPDGFFNELPDAGLIWIKRTGVSQPPGATLKVYEGGNMMEGMEAWTMQEIYSVDGFAWPWDGLMQHDYFTADTPGNYSMSFEVYVGSPEGTPIEGFAPATTTFDFVVVPEPACLTLLFLGAIPLLVPRRAAMAHAAVVR